MTPKLSLKNISTPILKNISLEIFLSDFVVLLGGNGSGKSSLIKIINGQSLPTSGSISLDGNDIVNRPIHKRAQSITTLAQDPNLATFSQLTVLENCLISVKKKREQIGCHLATYSAKLASALDLPVSSLSGGERQTLALAMALYRAPSLLLLDEHTSALDVAMASKLMALTANIAREQAITTLMTTHNLDDALRYGNRLVVMRQGEVIHDFNEREKMALTRADLLGFYGAAIPK